MEKSHSLIDSHYKTFIGFWMYLMSDVILFAVLFAVFFVLRNATFQGPSLSEIFSYRRVLIETLVLLTAGFASGPLFIAVDKEKKGLTCIWLFILTIFGSLFLILQINDFLSLWEKGMRWTQSGFLSAYYTLVGTHALHILFGLVWIFTLMVQTSIWEFSSTIKRRFHCLKMFWQFVYFLWIFVFTFVYMMSEYATKF